MKKITILVGSLRRESIARKIAKNVINLFPEGYEAEIYEIGDLPLYNADYDNANETYAPLPEAYTRFREHIKASAGVLFVTPENNRLVPAVIKNAIDVGSKPNDDVAWTKTPAGIISHSVGAMGGYSSQKSLRLALSYFHMPITGQPEVFIGKSAQYFDKDSEKMNNEDTLKFLQKYIDVFVDLVEKNPKA
ncbi:MAG: NADPH-dependent FMN reductase [Filifactor alocis]|nr:NADPH-dependent FMN reductase [Filifactor alocis]